MRCPYVYHTGTTNQSFVKTSTLLRERYGVTNNMFMLALFDTELAGVDPHDPNLSLEMQRRVTAECIRNLWYFIREVVRVPVSGPPIPFELHLGNLFLLWCMSANINTYLVLPRQNYKTVSACAFYLWAFALASTNSHILFFNKALDDSKNNLKRVNALKDELPQWMLVGIDDPVNDLNNIEYAQSGHRKNRIDAKAPGRDPVHADKQGRGATSPMTWYDELSFMGYCRDTYMAAAPAGSQAKATAAKFGRPYGTTITTTPNMIDDPSGAFAFKLRNGSLRFREGFYDLGPRRVKELIDTQAEFPFIYAEYTWEQLGRSPEWFRTQCRELMGDMLKIKREILLVWPMSGEGSIFVEEQLDRLATFKKPIVVSLPVQPREGQVPPGLTIDFVEMPDPNVPYIVSVDTATGAGLDYHAFVFLHPHDMRQIGVLRNNTTDDDQLKAIAKFIFVEMFPNSIPVIERNYLGIVLINFLVKEERIEPRLFYLEKEKVAERAIGKHVVRQKSIVRVYGVDTTADSREAMMRHLFQIVEELPHLITLESIQNEIKTLQRKKTGKIEHRSGFHDDQLMAFLIGIYADRHDQPVLRRLLARSRSVETSVAVNTISNLNTESGLSPIAVQNQLGGTRREGSVSAEGERVSGVEEYIRSEMARREKGITGPSTKQLGYLVASLNTDSGGDPPPGSGRAVGPFGW